jgi:hypothetical protein
MGEGAVGVEDLVEMTQDEIFRMTRMDADSIHAIDHRATPMGHSSWRFKAPGNAGSASRPDEPVRGTAHPEDSPYLSVVSAEAQVHLVLLAKGP